MYFFFFSNSSFDQHNEIEKINGKVKCFFSSQFLVSFGAKFFHQLDILSTQFYCEINLIPLLWMKCLLLGGRKPIYLTSTNVHINTFSIVPWGSRKQMSIGKIHMLDGLVSTHCLLFGNHGFIFRDFYQTLAKLKLYSPKMNSIYCFCYFYLTGTISIFLLYNGPKISPC